MSGSPPSRDQLRTAYLRNRLSGRARQENTGVGSVSRGDPVLLSFGQQRLWAMEQSAPGGVAYLAPWVLRLRGAVDVGALRAAVAGLVGRHEVLRTRFGVRGGVPVQIIDEASEVDWAVVDVKGGEVDSVVRGLCRWPVDLVSGPVMRVRLLRCGMDDHVLVVMVHHMACDGWSEGVLARELRSLYAAFVGGGDGAGLAPVGVQFADFAAWQRAWLSGAVLEREVAFWRERLVGVVPLALPTDRPRPVVPDDAGDTVEFVVPHTVGAAVRELARQHNGTTFMVLLAAYQALLSRYCQQDDIVVGTPVAGRQRPELRDAVGFYTNTLLLRADLSSDPTFGEFVDQVRETALDAFSHQDFPIERLEEILRPVHEVGRSAIFPTEFALQNYEDTGFIVGDLTAEPMLVTNDSAKFELSLRLMERPDGSLVAGMEFASAVFDRSTVERIAAHYGRLLADACANPDRRISQLRLLTPAEEAQWTDRFVPAVSQPGLLHELFHQQRQQRPDAVAVVDGPQTLTYAQLDDRSAALAARLRALGAGPGAVVGIALPGSADVVVAVLAVLRTGAAYVPIDREHPADIRLAVTDDAGSLPAGLVAVSPSATDEPPAELDTPSSGDAPAYIHDGVMVTHGNVIGLLAATRQRFSFGADDTWTLCHTSDVWELWGALLHGGRLVIVPSAIASADFLALVVDQRVTVLSQTPSAFLGLTDAVREHPEAASTWRLRHLVFPGAALDLAMLRPWYDLCGTAGPQVVTMYGSAETTFHATGRLIDPSEVDGPVARPIGQGMPGMRVMLLDRHLNPVPVGVPGEIFVGGVGVTLGHVGRSGPTAERYLPDPYGAPGQRMVRTGDRARQRPDGELEFLGRIDDQVTIRGFPVELREVESRLRSHPDVGSCVVITRDLGAGEHQLLAYVTAAPGTEPRVPDLRRHLSEALPAYMVPAHLTVLAELDVAALPMPAGVAGEYLAPRTVAEQVAAAVWADVLEVDRVGVTDSFFELGGDTIRAVRLVGQLEPRGITVSVQDVYRHPTVAALVAAEGRERRFHHVVRPFELLPDGTALPDGVVDAYPLSMVQAGMLYELLADPDLRPYHNVTTHPIENGPLSADALQTAADALVASHETLRTSFDITGDEPLQRVHQHAAAEVVVTDLRGQDEPARRAAVEECVRRERERPFDLREPPLMRWHAFTLTDRTWLLVVTECHAIVDAWSHHLLFDELLTTYEAGRCTAPRRPDVRIADFVALEQQAVDSDTTRSFWQSRLADYERLPAPAAWGEEASVTTIRVEFADLEPGLRQLARDCGVPVTTVLLAAHVTALGVVTGRRRFCTGLVCDGRPERPSGDRVAGMFLNPVPLTIDLDGRTGRDVVTAVFRDEVALLPHRRYPLPLMQRQWGNGKPLLAAVFDHRDAATTDSPTEFPLHVTAAPGALLLTARAGGARLLGSVYRAVLERFVAAPDAPATVGCLPAAVASRLVALGNDTDAAVPDATAAELVAAQARATPQRTALVVGGDRMTYADLDHAVDRLAGHLRSHGARPGAVIGVCLPRRAGLVVSLLAVLRTGAAYLPLDPDHPLDRRTVMLADAGAALVLIDGTTAPEDTPDGVKALDVTALLRAEPDGGDVDTRPHQDDAAYLIYTSGSTGKPKGVVVPHRALTNFLTSMRQRPGMAADDVLLAVTTVSFDISILELFLPLTCGATVVLADRSEAVDAEALVGLIDSEGVTVLQATPATWRMLRELEWRPTTRLVALSGGEKLPPDLAAWLAETGVVGWDMYGPTETTVWSSTARIGAGGRLTDWAPVANTTIHVLDADLQPVLPGATGELYIGGAGVALGYQGRGDLTAARFVPDPHAEAPGGRLYRTGDSAVRHADGRVEILGRLDHQVKIRGHRVEPGEAETVLLSHPGVPAAVVHPTRTGKGDLQLTAYVAGLAESASVADLRSYLAARLPQYLVPAAFVTMATLPLNTSGKVDRRALPAPDAGQDDDQRPVVEPRTDDETVLAELWATALGVPRVGVYDDFVELGGHSLVALRIVTTARERGLTVEFTDLMARRTIAGVLHAAAPGDALVWFRRTGTRTPLFCVHPGGGGAHWYGDLARELGADQPLAAFEWPGLHGAADHPDSVERIARRYLAELRQAQQAGPYRLLGWGGASGVAWEMTRLLRHDGHSVDLFLLDPAVDVEQQPTVDDELAAYWRCEELFNALAFAADEAEKGKVAEEIVAVLADVTDDKVSAAGLDTAWRDRVRVWRQLLETAMDHTFEPMPGRLHLLVGDEVTHGMTYGDYLHRWHELATGGVDAHRVPGNHLGVLRPPHVATLAARLTELMSGSAR